MGYPIIAPADNIVDRLITTVQVLYTFSLIFNLKLNFKIGKTQASLKLRGSQSKNVRTTIASNNDIIECVVEKTIIPLTICDIYKHLGIKTTAELAMGPEIASKRAWYNKTITPQLRKMLKEEKINLKYRKELIFSIILSGILYGSSTWTYLNKRDENQIHALIMKAYRLLLPNKYSQHDAHKLSDKEILRRLDLPTPANMIKMQRILMLTRLLKGQHKSILYIMSISAHHDQSWMALVKQAIISLWPVIQDEYTLDEFTDVISPGEDQMREFILNRIMNERKVIKTRIYTWDANRHYVHECPAAVNIVAVQHKCPECVREFVSPGMMALHMIQQHNRHPPTYYYINTPWCPICMKYYETITRVREHIRRTKCYPILLANYDVLDPTMLPDIDAHSKINRRNLRNAGFAERHGRTQVFRIPGPLNRHLYGTQQIVPFDEQNVPNDIVHVENAEQEHQNLPRIPHVPFSDDEEDSLQNELELLIDSLDDEIM